MTMRAIDGPEAFSGTRQMRAERSEIMSVLINLAVGAIKPPSTVRADCSARFAATGYAFRRARKTRPALAACALIAVGVLACCSSPATGPSSAAAARPAVSAATAAAARVFVSPHYGYTVTLPAGWSAQAAQPFAGPGTAGLTEYGPDVFHGPPYVVAWAFAAKPAGLAGYATAIARAAAQLVCPAVPQLDQQVTIAGATATLTGMSCPTQGGVYLLAAGTTHNQTALVFVFQDSSGIKAAEPAGRIAFRELLAGIRFR